MTAPTAAPAAADPALAARGLAATPDLSKRSAASDAAVLTGATYLAQVMTFAGGLVQKALLGPAGAGLWALMQSFWTYMTIATLGASAGTGRQVPMYRGREDFDGAARAADTGSAFSITAVGVVGVLVAGFAAVFGDGWSQTAQWGVVLLGLTAPLRQFSDCHKDIFQATRRFYAASLTNVAEAALLLTVQTLCVAVFGFYGMFAGIVLSIGGLYLLWVRRGLTGLTRPAFRWRYDREKIGDLIGFGAPLMIQGQIWLLFMSIDNLIVAGFISIKDLGYYALAVSVTGYLLHLPRSVAAALFPRMAEEFGRTGDIRTIRHYAVDTQRLLAFLLVPVFLGAAFFFLPVLVRHALPAFTPAVPLIRIMVAASFLIALVNMPTKVLTTAGYRWGITALTLSCLGINATANYVAVAVLDQGLEGAAVATALSYLVAFVLMTSYALSKAFTGREVAAHVAGLLAVFAYVIAAVWGIEALVGSGEGAVVPEAAIAAGKMLLFLAVMTPWFALAQARYQGPQRLLEMGRSGLRAMARSAGRA